MLQYKSDKHGALFKEFEMPSLAASTKTQHQVQRGLLLDIIVRQGTSIFELLSREDEPLLIWWDALFILDLCLHVINRVAGFHVQRDRLARQRLDKNLHASTKTQHEVQRGLLLDIIVRKGTSIFKLLSREDEPLLIWRDALFILDLCLHVINPM